MNGGKLLEASLSLSRSGRIEGAIELLHTALEQPEMVSVSLKMQSILAKNAGALSVSIGNLEGGVSFYRRALKLNPNEGMWHWEMARLYELLGDSEQTRKHRHEVERLVPVDPDLGSWWKVQDGNSCGNSQGTLSARQAAIGNSNTPRNPAALPCTENRATTLPQARCTAFSSKPR